jgi:hypothetical protein
VRVLCALHPPRRQVSALCVALGHRGAMDAAEFAAWLGEEVGEESFSLPENVQKALKKAFNDGIIDEEDVPEDGALGTSQAKDGAALWRDFYADGAKLAKLETLSSDVRKLERWFLARVRGENILEDDAQEEAPSKQLKEDLEAQGATAPAQLGLIELALASGRVPALAETKGYSHKAPWAKMEGGKHIVKYKQDNLDEILARGQEEEVNTHFTSLAEKLMQEDDAFSHKLAARVLRHWHDAKKLRSQKATLFYVKAYRKKYAGRGMPVVTDRDLMTEAMSAQMAGDLSDTGKGVVDLGSMRTSVASSSKASSELGSSISGSVTDLDNKMAGRLNEVLSAVAGITTELSSLKASVMDLKSTQGNLASQMRNMKGSSSKPGERKCFRCGSTDHEIKDCPEPPKV